MVKIAIIDDELDAIIVLTKFVELYLSDYQIVGNANNVDSAVSLIRAENPDVLLLDIQLSDGTGFDILDHFERRLFKVIFVTAYDQYAIKAFKYHAVNYLLKPISPKEFCQAFDQLNSLLYDNLALQFKLGNETESINSKLTIPTLQGFTKVKVKDILHIESEGNYTTFHLQGDTRILTTRNIGYFEALLDPLFYFRVHQSHIVNLDFIKAYINKENGGIILLENGDKVPLARRKKESFLKIFMK